MRAISPPVAGLGTVTGRLSIGPPFASGGAIDAAAGVRGPRRVIVISVGKGARRICNFALSWCSGRT